MQVNRLEAGYYGAWGTQGQYWIEAVGKKWLMIYPNGTKDRFGTLAEAVEAAERHDNRQQAKNEEPVGRGQLASRLERALSRASQYDDPFSYLVMIVEEVIEDLREAV